MAENHVALAESLHAKQDKMAPEQVNMRDVTGRPKPLEDTVPREQGVMDEQFPTAALTAKDPRDRVMAAKLALQTPGQPGYTTFGKLEAKDSDFEWYQRKAAAVEAAQFQAWFAKEFDRMSPADKKRAKELYPQFYAQRMALLKQQTENLFGLGRIKVNGVEDMDDVKTLYLLESGRLDLGPLQNLIHPEMPFSMQGADEPARRMYAQAKFQRGLLSPFRVFGDEATPTFNNNGNQWTGSQMRAEEARNFRPATDDAFQAGLGNRGFPPFSGTAPLQEQDAAWWQKLRGQF